MGEFKHDDGAAGPDFSLQVRLTGPVGLGFEW